MIDCEARDQREVMITRDLRGRGIRDEAVLSAMSTVPRHRFVLPEYQHLAYSDAPLPIGEQQTISQPYIVALMTEALCLKGGERVLEIGTGSGYQSAVLAELDVDLWSIERSALLFSRAGQCLENLGYENIHLVHSDGTLGLPAEAPFDRILATGSLPDVPQGLLDQLAEGGMLIGPVGGWDSQQLVRIVYHANMYK